MSVSLTRPGASAPIAAQAGGHPYAQAGGHPGMPAGYPAQQPPHQQGPYPQQSHPQGSYPPQQQQPYQTAGGHGQYPQQPYPQQQQHGQYPQQQQHGQYPQQPYPQQGQYPGAQAGGGQPYPGQQVTGQPYPQQQGGVISLTKGQNISLTKHAPTLVNARIGLGWDVRTSPGAPFDLDASLFLLTGAGRVRGPQDFIFYNNKQSMDGSVLHSGDNQTGVGEGDDETVTVDLMRVPPEIQRVVVACSIFEGEQRGQNFTQVPRAFIRIVNQHNGQEVVRYDLSSQGGVHTAMIFGELCKVGSEWQFRAIGNPCDGGLRGLAATYGVQIA